MNLEPLYSYQQDNAKRLLGLLRPDGGAACDRSEMGTGKTYTAAVVARELGFVPIVICPKSTISNWEEVFRSVGLSQPYLITNYEKLRIGKHPHLYNPASGWDTSTRYLIIFDEAHRLRARKTKQTKILIDAKRSYHRILLLSATLVQSPLDISAIGYSLGLFDRPAAWWQYARRFGGVLNLRGYYDWDGSPAHLAALHRALDAKGVRTRISDLDCDLPCTTRVELIDVPCPSLRDIYKRIQKEALESNDEAKFNSAALVARGKAREEAEKAKIPWLAQEAKNLTKEGYSVVIFVNFRDGVSALIHELTGCAVVWGDQTERMRSEEVCRFQTNSTKILLANIKAGGIGLSLHDTEGKHPRVSLISPPESAIDLLQCLGRIRRMGMVGSATNRIVFASESVERKVFTKVKQKLNHLATLNDGDLEYEL